MAEEVSVRLEVGAAGAVVVKRARGVATALVRREAEVLGRVGHPGLVELVGCREREGAAELITVHAGSATLAQHSPASAATIAWLGAGIASTLADLHAAGLAHTRLGADHVVLDGTGRTVLCSLGRAREVTASTVRTDLDDLLALLADLVERLPDRRLGARRTQRALEAVLATGREAGATMAQVAALLAAIPGVEPPIAVPVVEAEGSPPGVNRVGHQTNPEDVMLASRPRPEAEVEAGPSGEPAGGVLPVDVIEGTAPGGATRTWRDRVPAEPAIMTVARPRRLWLPLALVAVAAGFLGGGALLATGSKEAPRHASVSGRTVGTVAPVAVTGAASPSIASSGSPGLGPSVEAACRGAAVSAACTGDVELFGGVVRVGAEWYELAGYRDGDAAFLGDWDCDGMVTPMVYRASTGRLYEFDDWSGANLEVRSAVQADQKRVRKVETDGCDALAHRTAVGDLEPLAAG